LVDHVAVGSPKVGTMPGDWLIQPEIGLLTMTSHPGPKLMSSRAANWRGILQDSGLLNDVMSGSPPADRPVVGSGQVFTSKSTSSIEESNLTPFKVQTVPNH